MKIFVTGATGFVGSAVVPELLRSGHQVLGLARSDEAAASLTAAGAGVQRGSLQDLDSLKRGAAASDGVIHTAFIHDFHNFGDSANADRLAIETMGNELAGSGKPFVVTSGTLLVKAPRGVVTEEDVTPVPGFPRVSEQTGLAFASQGVRAMALRLPPSVHGKGDHGFVPHLIAIAREKGVSAYVGDGRNVWAAVHRLDAATLYRLAIEKGSAGARYHGVGDEGIPTREIAEAIGRQLNVPVVSITPEEAGEHFDWLGRFFTFGIPASSTLTQQQLGWRPAQPGLIDDIEAGHYFEAAAAR